MRRVRSTARRIACPTFATLPKMRRGLNKQAAAISREQRTRAATQGARPPTFEVRQVKTTARWYVRVLWRFGQEQYISGFASADDAESWIRRKSEDWLRIRTTALRSFHPDPVGEVYLIGGKRQ
jgi:hypothetical protein